MWKMLSVLFTGLLYLCGKIIGMSFLRMAFIAFLLRLFVVFPIGPLVALVMGVVWFVPNIGRVLDRLRSVGNRFTA